MEEYKVKPPIGSDYLLPQAFRKKRCGVDRQISLIKSGRWIKMK